MPESFVVFIHSLGECELIAEAFCRADEAELAIAYGAPVHEPENIEEWGPLLSVDDTLALQDHLRSLDSEHYRVGQRLRHHTGAEWEVDAAGLSGDGKTWCGGSVLGEDDYIIRCVKAAGPMNVDREGRLMRVHRDYLHGDGWTPLAVPPRASNPLDALIADGTIPPRADEPR